MSSPKATEHVIFSSGHGLFSRTDCGFGHQAALNNARRLESFTVISDNGTGNLAISDRTVEKSHKDIESK